MKLSKEKLSSYLLYASITFGVIIIGCVIHLIGSFINHYSEISPEQQISITLIQEQMPEIKPVIEDAEKDDVITQQEYNYIINASNEIQRRGLFK